LCHAHEARHVHREHMRVVVFVVVAMVVIVVAGVDDGCS